MSYLILAVLLVGLYHYLNWLQYRIERWGIFWGNLALFGSAYGAAFLIALIFIYFNIPR